ncbi:MAG: helix-turn-helix transcriptional regulator [Halococcoides sp.]
MDGPGVDRGHAVLKSIIDKQYVLAALDDDQPISLSELAEATDHAKSTVNRTVRRFEEAGLLERHVETSGHTYTLTHLGAQLLEWYDEGLERLACEQLYAALPPSASLPWWVVESGSVELATATVAKHSVFDQIIAFFDRIDEFRVVAPNLTRDANWTYLADRIVEDGLDMEMILTEAYLDTLMERFGDRLPTLVADHGLDALTVADVDFPYGFGMGYYGGGSELAIISYDENYYSANGTVVSDRPEAVAWGERRYESYRERAVNRNDEVLEAGE